MRRSIFLFIILFLFSSSAFCQGLFSSAEETQAQNTQDALTQEVDESTQAKSEISYSNERFSWKKVDNAASYFVEIKQQKEKDWETVYTVQTTKTEILVPLKTGNYQVIITPANVLGKKGNPSKPLKFKVVDNTSPYLYAFHTENRGARPVLSFKKWFGKYILNRQKCDIKAEEKLKKGKKDEYEDTDVFMIRGKNIFDEDTIFELHEQNLVGKNTNTPPLKLTVVRRDESNNTVYLTAPYSELKKGNYELSVRKINGNSVEVPIRIDTLYKKPVYCSSFRVALDFNMRDWNNWKNTMYEIDFNLAEISLFDFYAGLTFNGSKDYVDCSFKPELAIIAGFNFIPIKYTGFEFMGGLEIGYSFYEKGVDFEDNDLYLSLTLGVCVANTVDLKFLLGGDHLAGDSSHFRPMLCLGYKYQFRNK